MTMGSTMQQAQSDIRCDKCGAEITTGLIAVFCPLVEQCEFWVPEQAEFLHELRAIMNPPGEDPYDPRDDHHGRYSL